MKITTLLLTHLLAIAAIDTSNAVHYKATNDAAATLGGARFTDEIGLTYAKQTLRNASTFIWSTFGQSKQARKNVDLVTLIIESMGGIAYASDNMIHMSSEYIGNYSGDVKIEFTGIMYHEVTHIWQWNGKDKAPSGLIEGIADYVRLKAGYAPSHWVKPGEGKKWDEGYDVTAHFLDYCSEKRSDFVAQINVRLKYGYSSEFFKQLLGKTVHELWSDYKAKYGA